MAVVAVGVLLSAVLLQTLLSRWAAPRRRHMQQHPGWRGHGLVVFVVASLSWVVLQGTKRKPRIWVPLKRRNDTATSYILALGYNKYILDLDRPIFDSFRG